MRYVAPPTTCKIVVQYSTSQPIRSEAPLRRIAALIAIAALFFAACGDDSESSDPPETTTTTTTTEAPADDPAESEIVDDDHADDTSTPVDEPDDAPAGPTAVGLAEFSVTVDGDIAAGVQTFAVTNEGQFPHEFGIAMGTSYEDLPKLETGAIDEEALGADFLGKTEILDAGAMTEVGFDLAPGDYVLFCNIAFGPNSHAASGQTLSVSVG